MMILKGTYQNGTIKLDEPLPENLEGKEIQVIVQEIATPKHRQSGSAKGKIWMSSDFDEPLADFGK